MKNKNIIKLFLLLVLTAPGCLRSPSPDPLKFTAHEGNPILHPGEPGEWDELFIWNPQVIQDKGIYYLFYLGGNISGNMAIGLATSPDGFHFMKYEGNPILRPDNVGFDAFTVGPGMVLKKDSLWLMYYNAQDLVAFAPGCAAGRAFATSPFGPWVLSEGPVIRSGSQGEWDAGFIIPSSVILLDDSQYIMFYSGGKDISSFDDFYVGMATSEDGIRWVKYNDPSTTDHPFHESDPVLTTGRPGEWDGGFVWMANVKTFPGGFRMFYSAAPLNLRKELKAIGYAVSSDGIHWEKYPGNPVYGSGDDHSMISGKKAEYMENPAVLFMDTICLMYYEYGPFQVETTYIGVATAPL